MAAPAAFAEATPVAVCPECQQWRLQGRGGWWYHELVAAQLEPPLNRQRANPSGAPQWGAPRRDNAWLKLICVLALGWHYRRGTHTHTHRHTPHTHTCTRAGCWCIVEKGERRNAVLPLLETKRQKRHKERERVRVCVCV